MIRYRDKLGHDRQVHRLIRHGVFVCDCKTPKELAKVVDLARLTEDDPRDAAAPADGADGAAQ